MGYWCSVNIKYCVCVPWLLIKEEMDKTVQNQNKDNKRMKMTRNSIGRDQVEELVEGGGITKIAEYFQWDPRFVEVDYDHGVDGQGYDTDPEEISIVFFDQHKSIRCSGDKIKMSRKHAQYKDAPWQNLEPIPDVEKPCFRVFYSYG